MAAGPEWHGNRLGVREIVEVLRASQARCARGELAVLRVSTGDPRVDWPDLAGCDDGGIPSLPFGQASSCRFSTDGADGLHAHYYPDRVEFHLDASDPRRSLIGHALADTMAAPGMAAGLLVSVLAPRVVGAIAGAAVGLALGSLRPARARWRIFGLDITTPRGNQ
jgi:hypothetical protein